MKQETIDLLLQKGTLAELDVQFGRFATRISGKEDENLFLAAALVSHLQGEGHICLDISSSSMDRGFIFTVTGITREDLQIS
jgi:hypothetical protein